VLVKWNAVSESATKRCACTRIGSRCGERLVASIAVEEGLYHSRDEQKGEPVRTSEGTRGRPRSGVALCVDVGPSMSGWLRGLGVKAGGAYVPAGPRIPRSDFRTF